MNTQWLISKIGMLLIIGGIILIVISGLIYARRTGDYFRVFLNLRRLNLNTKERLIGFVGFILVLIGVFI